MNEEESSLGDDGGGGTGGPPTRGECWGDAPTVEAGEGCGDTGEGWGDGDSGLSGISATSTFNGSTTAPGTGATTWTSSSELSMWKSSYCSILQQESVWICNYDPFTPTPTPLFNIPFISSLTPILHLLDFDFLQRIFIFFQPPEPDSYPNHKTPICTPEGPPTINVVERRKMKKKNEWRTLIW